MNHPLLFTQQPYITPQPSVPMVPKNATTLYIGDLDEQINEEYLYQKFCQFGQIFTLKIAKDSNKKSKGFAFITYYQKADGNIFTRYVHSPFNKSHFFKKLEMGQFINRF
jgi:RNA recognition motif-containing protein